MFSLFFLNKKILAVFLIVTVFFLFPAQSAYASGGGSGQIFSIIFSIVRIVVGVVMVFSGVEAGVWLIATGIAGLGTSGDTGKKIDKFFGWGEKKGTEAPSITHASQSEIAILSGAGIVGSCPEGFYNSQNDICVPIGNQSCLEVGVRGFCPAGTSCSASYGGSCWPGRATQPPVTIDFSVDKPEPSINETVTFVWNSTGATYCGFNQDIGGVNATGTFPIVFQKSGIWDYVIRCAGEGGEQKKIITIDIPPVITSLTTDRTFMGVLSRTTLAWTTQNARECSLDNNIGVVGTSGTTQKLFDSTGEKTVNFVCSGRGGIATSTVSIDVVSQVEFEMTVLSTVGAGSNSIITTGLNLSSLQAGSNNLVSSASGILGSLGAQTNLAISGGGAVTPPPPTSPPPTPPTAPASQCPEIAPPAPDFCTNGTIQSQFNIDECVIGFQCVLTTPPPAPAPSSAGTTIIFNGGSGGNTLSQETLTSDLTTLNITSDTPLIPRPHDGLTAQTALNPGEALALQWDLSSTTESQFCALTNDADSDFLQIPAVCADLCKVVVHPIHTANYTILCPDAEPKTQRIFVRPTAIFQETAPE